MGSALPDGLVRTELLRGQDGTWRIQSLWRDRAALTAAREASERPAAPSCSSVWAPSTHTRSSLSSRARRPEVGRRPSERSVHRRSERPPRSPSRRSRCAVTHGHISALGAVGAARERPFHGRAVINVSRPHRLGVLLGSTASPSRPSGASGRKSGGRKSGRKTILTASASPERFRFVFPIIKSSSFGGSWSAFDGLGSADSGGGASCLVRRRARRPPPGERLLGHARSRWVHARVVGDDAARHAHLPRSALTGRTCRSASSASRRTSPSPSQRSNAVG
jgi:hypothetical protein